MGKTKNVSVNSDAKTTKVDKYAQKHQEEMVKVEKKAKVSGKRISEAKRMVDKNREYSLSEAIELVKKTSTTKFVSSVEMHSIVRKEGISVQVALPHGTGKEKKVVLANAEVISDLENGKINFDVLLATADTMPKLVKFAKLLGPRGLMPNPKNGTLIKNDSDAKNFAVDKVTVKTEKSAAVIHTMIGKVNMDDKALMDNIKAVIAAVGERQFVKIYLSSSMGPSVRVELPR
jgi:large subunit ribosomal protein L1